jgi:alkylated DNA repair dioxygenase AlkB
MPRPPLSPAPGQPSLFDAPLPLPEGMHHESEFLTAEEEAHWIALVQTLPLKEMNYKGYTARRRVVSYGGKYDYDANRLEEAAPIPPALYPLREKAAAWTGIADGDFSHALVAEYREGTPLGWHRDVPDFELVVGVSLGAPCRMRFRPYPPVQPKKSDVLTVELAPRSAYVMRGAARWRWQHSIAPTPALRHSITFRTRVVGTGAALRVEDDVA